MTLASPSTSSPACSPTWATPRRPDRPTVGAGVARVAHLLGRPLAPWQRDWVDVAGEVLPDGRLAYSRVIGIVPRRAGKTIVALAEGLDAGRRARRRRAFYASHRRETAAALWRDDWFPITEESPLARHMQLRRANGSEAFTWAATGSTLRLLPPDGDAMRSLAANLAMVDEGREFTAGQGEAIEAGALPTLATGAGGQFWVMSSSGDASSEWLIRWRDIGRGAVDADRDRGICYLEYAAPAGADPDDEATWWAAHPGLGHHVLLDALRADHELMAPDVFAMEYLGIWPETRIDRELVDAWALAADPTSTLVGWPVFAVETSVERDRTVIVAAGRTATGAVTVELVEDRPHGPWLDARLAHLVDTHRPLAVTWDAAGPVAASRVMLEELAAPPAPLNTRDVAAASGSWKDRVLARGVTHRDDDRLTTAVAAARQRNVGGAWLYDRRATESLPMVAAVLAVWTLLDGTRAPPTIR
jgi:hypothetical protein